MSTNAVSFKTDILPLFTPTDIGHMSRMGIKLDDYTYMSDPAPGTVKRCGPFDDHAHARAVYNSLTGACQPRMPMGGPYWNDTQLATYLKWMNDGFQP